MGFVRAAVHGSAEALGVGAHARLTDPIRTTDCSVLHCRLQSIQTHHI